MHSSSMFRSVTRLISILACAAMLMGGLPALAYQSGPDAAQRARDLLARMTLEEKVDMLHGEVNNFYGYYNAPIPRLGIPALTMADGPAGVRINNPDVNGQRATQLPAPLALAATWDPALAEQYGALMGQEAHLTGHNVQLGPVLDIMRVPQGGRAFEGFGEDPLLSGTLGAAEIQGIQSNPVIATVKHSLAHNQEEYRHNDNVVIDERTLQEIYARPFAIAVRDGQPASIMCAYNRINGVFACQSDVVLNEIMKTQFDFQGWVMSDYGANYSTGPSILAGLDQEQPGAATGGEPGAYGPAGTCNFCQPLIDAVHRGEVPESRIDAAVLRILTMMFEYGLFDAPPVVAPLPVAEHGAEALTIAEQSMVLLKNDGVLPLAADKIGSIAVIGSDADTVVAGGGSSLVKPTYEESPLAGIRSRAGAGVTVEHLAGSDPVTSAALMVGPEAIPSDFLTPANGQGHGLRAEYFQNLDLSGKPAIDRIDPYAAINGGFLWFGGMVAASPHFLPAGQAYNSNSSFRWTGSLTAPVTGSYELAITSNSTSRLFIDGKLVTSTTPVASTSPVGATETTIARFEFEAGSTHDVRAEIVSDYPSGIEDAGPRFKLGWVPPAGVVAPRAQAAAKLAAKSDVAIVLVRDYSTEGGDHSLSLPNGQAEVIRQVAAANPRTIVVMTTAGATQTSDWDGAVPAVLDAFYGGQEQGNPIARILFGDVNPSGRLPFTMPVDAAHTVTSKAEQYPGVPASQLAAAATPAPAQAASPGYGTGATPAAGTGTPPQRHIPSCTRRESSSVTEAMKSSASRLNTPSVPVSPIPRSNTAPCVPVRAPPSR